MNNDETPRAIIYYAGFRHRSGGAFKHADEIAAELKCRGWQVRIFCNDDLPLLLRFLPTIIGRIINAVASPLGFYYRGRIASCLFRKFCQHKGADLVIFEEIYISWNTLGPAVTMLHATWSDNLHGVAHRDYLKARLIEKEEFLINRISHPVITVSSEYREFLTTDLFSKKMTKEIHVVPLALDASKIPQASSEKERKGIVFTGRLEARKNLRLLIEVFECFHVDNPEWTLTIIGDGPMQKELEAQANDKALPVVFCGRLGKTEVFETLLQNRVYLHTSTKESFSFALLEAKLCGLATCAFEGLQVPSEFIDYPVWSFKQRDWLEALTKAVQFGPVSTVNADDYSPSRMLEKTLEIARLEARES
jgi:glycosyltransferase involved in cell wall biosynthesis